jgi:hypothetical protein
MIFLCAVAIILLAFILWYSLRNNSLNKIRNKVNNSNKKLNNIIQDKHNFGYGTFLTWYNLNLEETLLRILTKTIGNNIKRGEMIGKMWVACESIDKLISMDYTVRTLVTSGGIGIEDIEEMKKDRENLVVVVNQSFLDISDYLNS